MRFRSRLWKRKLARRFEDVTARVENVLAGSSKGQTYTVMSGPFAGMLYAKGSWIFNVAPMVTGSYESELHETIEKIVEQCPTTIIDIGCAEGYYAVGLAMRLPNAHIYAFDTDPHAQRYCRTMAKLNNVGNRMTIAGTCTHDTLRKYTTEMSLILCDCEGCEFDLLQPQKAPELGRASLLIELHESIVPDVTASITARFEQSHDIRLISVQPRDPQAYPVLRNLQPADQQFALSEFRTGVQRWAFLSPKYLEQWM